MSKKRKAASLASRFIHKKRMKTAGEVRFIKDNSGDEASWAFNQNNPTERDRDAQFEYQEQQLEPLAECMLSTTAAMAHAMKAYELFNNVRSSEISPDGKLGGRGYIQSVRDMRKAYTNIVEALSAIGDTIYDEIRAPHWAQISREEEETEESQIQKKVDAFVAQTEEIRGNPKEWVAEDSGRIMKEEIAQPQPKRKIKRKNKEEAQKKEEEARIKKEKEEEEARKKKEKEEEARLKKEQKEKEEEEARIKKEEEEEEKARLEKEKEEEEARLKKEKEEEAARKKKEKKTKQTSPSKRRDKELKDSNRTPFRRK